MSDHLDKVCLIGAGQMALDYANVLRGLECPYEVVGRGTKSAESFEAKTGTPVFRGGIEVFLKKAGPAPKSAIIAVGVDYLAPVTLALLERGTRKILVEKPAGLTTDEIRSVAQAASTHGAQVFVAYNRRFYESVREARRLIAEDGGCTSFQFEFTEWAHVIEKLPEVNVKREWFLANTTHVIDMAFFMGGVPKSMHCYAAGGVSWHPTASRFAGAGESESGALFSYSANWESPGRWGIEMITRKRRFIFRPLEKLQVQQIGSVAVSELPLQDKLDKDYKPGLYRQTEAFLAPAPTVTDETLLPIAEHARRLSHYEKMRAPGRIS